MPVMGGGAGCCGGAGTAEVPTGGGRRRGRRLHPLPPPREPHPGRVRPGRPPRRPDVRRRGPRLPRGPPGPPLRRPLRPAPQPPPGRHRPLPPGRLYLQRGQEQTPEPRPAAGRDRRLPALAGRPDPAGRPQGGGHPGQLRGQDAAGDDHRDQPAAGADTRSRAVLLPTFHPAALHAQGRRTAGRARWRRWRATSGSWPSCWPRRRRWTRTGRPSSWGCSEHGRPAAVVGRRGDHQAIGAAVAGLLDPGDVVGLAGDLGAGKTRLVQGAADALGADGPVLSPTFMLVREYDGDPPIHHVDAYRLSGPLELEDLGLEDVLGRRGGVRRVGRPGRRRPSRAGWSWSSTSTTTTGARSRSASTAIAGRPGRGGWPTPWPRSRAMPEPA